MGDDFRRTATAAEIVQMEALVDQEMSSGALGLSSGLEYEVGSYASTEEVVAMARVAATHGGFYISHIRDEADKSMEAIREAIAIGEKAKIPVQITHIKLGTVGVWGKAGEVVSMIEAARKRGVDVTADVYPYLAWSSNLKVLVPDKQWTNPASVKEALDDVGGGRNVQITRLPKFPQYVGKRLDEAAKLEGLSEVDMYIKIVQDDDAGVIGHTMIAEDMRVFLQQPWTMVASDGGINTSAPARRGHVPARAGALRARREVAVAAGGDQEDDVDAGGAAQAEGSRHDRRRHEGGPDDCSIRARSSIARRSSSRGCGRAASIASSSTGGRCGRAIRRRTIDPVVVLTPR